MRRISIFVFVVSLLIIFMVYDIKNDRILLTRNGMLTESLGKLFYTNVTKNRDNQSYPAPILILTYMRSGSTFLGDVIQASPDVFYIFEPLWSFQYHSWPLKDLYGNEIGGTFDEIARQVIKDVFTCQISKLPRPLFINEAFISVSRTTSVFSACKRNSTDILPCADLLQKQCLRSKYVMIKSIRIRAYELLDIKTDFPDLKVIHLIRDPRATLRSQKHYAMLVDVDESMFVREFCRNVTHDTQAIQIFKKFYPNDVHVVYHDSFETNSMSFSRELYKALDLPFNSIAEERVLKLTSNATNCTRDYSLCTSRYNSTFAIKQWRLQIPYSFVKLIDSSCGNVYSAHGYLPFSSVDILKNLSYPSHDPSLAVLPHLHVHKDQNS